MSGRRDILLSRVLPRVLSGVFLLVGAYTLWILFHSTDYVFGLDFGIYRAAAARWLSGGFYFYPEQLAGPYQVISGHVLYPPVALLLFIPFTVLPAVLWWVIPLGTIAACIYRLRPSPWGVAGTLGLLCWPYSVELAFTGNPTIWIVALLALSTRWSWVSAFVLTKPSLAPFALAGARSRAWWGALAVFLLACLAFAPMWGDWFRAITNARGPFSGLLYSVKDLPWMLIPSVAWISGSRRGSGWRLGKLPRG